MVDCFWAVFFVYSFSFIAFIALSYDSASVFIQNPLSMLLFHMHTAYWG